VKHGAAPAPDPGGRRAALRWGVTLALPWPRAGGAQVPPAGPRVALVVGNQRYGQAPLLNAVADARAVARALEGCGFAVQLLTDATQQQMRVAVERLGAGLQGRQGVGLLYFAGHGLQLDWRNYMLPVDADIAAATDVPGQALDVQGVLDRLATAGTRMNVVILDACRDNPFPRGAPGTEGLAPMDAPPGTFLAYATAPGRLAEDGAGNATNGPYARFLVQELGRAEARIEDVFKRVRMEVRRLTQGRQIPCESTSLVEEFSFREGIVAPAAADARARDAAFDRELAEWERVRGSTRADDLYAYLLRHPNGLFSEVAQARLERLQRAAVHPVPGRTGVAAPDIARRRYEAGDEVHWEVEDRLRGTRQVNRLRVTAADDERVEFNRGALVLSQNDDRIRDLYGEKRPAIVEVVVDMAVGRRWRSAFANVYRGVAHRNFYDSRVQALEDLETPMGPARCFRIGHQGESVNPDGRVLRLARTTWVDAARGQVLRSDATFRWAPTAPHLPPGEVSTDSSARIVWQRLARG